LKCDCRAVGTLVAEYHQGRWFLANPASANTYGGDWHFRGDSCFPRGKLAIVRDIDG
jgi:hypothetical protein